MRIAIPGKRGDLWRYALLPIIVLNLGSFAIFGVYYGLASQDPALTSRLGLGQVTVNLYLFVALVEWLFALALVRKAHSAGLGLQRLINPAASRRAPAAVLFVAFNAVFAVYVAAARASGGWPTMLDVATTLRLLVLVVVPASAAFCEELIWRSYLIDRLAAGGHGQRTAVGLAALSFALIHGIFLPDKLVVTFVLGLIGGAYYVRERHLLPLMVTHLVVDLWSFGLYLFAG